jgi:hypothetical protein
MTTTRPYRGRSFGVRPALSERPGRCLESAYQDALGAANQARPAAPRTYPPCRGRRSKTGESAEPDSWSTRLLEAIDWERIAQTALDKGLSEDEAMERLDGVLHEALSAALDQGEKSRAAALSETQHSMLREHRAKRDEFEARLVMSWGAPLDTYYTAFVSCAELGSMVNERQGARAVRDNDLKFEALRRLHARACSAASEIYALLRTGHANGAHGRWRTLHEIAVVTIVLAESAASLSERFLLHEPVEDLAVARAYNERHEALGVEPIDAAEIGATSSDG